ncbi:MULTISPECIES: CS1 type fimbrial major subunit [Stenotrophomonas]|uniref:CS1 type fimbrial major subunit n=1 Tax=Stenotrophomonas TaxID=40323 RepID=UPI00018FEA99|nr:CS1 type fimbrial major subunit [Stenotrophomonas sp. SKA14]EED38077.1 putative CS1 type fimbrial major subunit [Stenotrophomonas sp. SKA14]
MNAIIKKAALAAALATVSTSAFAIDTSITLYANVDSTLAFQKEDGSALDDSVILTYQPGGRGLSPWRENTRIFSNDESKDIEVKLGSDVELIPNTGSPGAKRVPMTVSLNNMKLTTAAQDLLASQIFDGAIQGRSIVLPLVIEQTTVGDLSSAQYQGMATIVLSQKP